MVKFNETLSDPQTQKTNSTSNPSGASSTASTINAVSGLVAGVVDAGLKIQKSNKDNAITQAKNIFVQAQETVSDPRFAELSQEEQRNVLNLKGEVAKAFEAAQQRGDTSNVRAITGALRRAATVANPSLAEFYQTATNDILSSETVGDKLKKEEAKQLREDKAQESLMSTLAQQGIDDFGQSVIVLDDEGQINIDATAKAALKVRGIVGDRAQLKSLTEAKKVNGYVTSFIEEADAMSEGLITSIGVAFKQAEASGNKVDFLNLASQYDVITQERITDAKAELRAAGDITLEQQDRIIKDLTDYLGQGKALFENITKNDANTLKQMETQLKMNAYEAAPMMYRAKTILGDSAMAAVMTQIDFTSNDQLKQAVSNELTNALSLGQRDLAANNRSKFEKVVGVLEGSTNINDLSKNDKRDTVNGITSTWNSWSTNPNLTDSNLNSFVRSSNSVLSLISNANPVSYAITTASDSLSQKSVVPAGGAELGNAVSKFDSRWRNVFTKAEGTVPKEELSNVANQVIHQSNTYIRQTLNTPVTDGKKYTIVLDPRTNQFNIKAKETALSDAETKALRQSDTRNTGVVAGLLSLDPSVQKTVTKMNNALANVTSLKKYDSSIQGASDLDIARTYTVSIKEQTGVDTGGKTVDFIYNADKKGFE